MLLLPIPPFHKHVTGYFEPDARAHRARARITQAYGCYRESSSHFKRVFFREKLYPPNTQKPMCVYVVDHRQNINWARRVQFNLFDFRELSSQNLLKVW